MKVYNNVLDMIGKTPVVELTQFDTGPCRLFVKLENQNPGGSVKDRIGLSMIEAAEKAGKIKPGDTLIEATAGNTGLGLALVASQKGYKLIIVLPDKMSPEKANTLTAMGAEVIMTRSDVGKGHPEYYQDKAAALAKETGAFYINQFCNPDNIAAHYNGTGPEIWEQMEHDVDAFVCGVGSSGTITGVGRYLKALNPDFDMVVADPEGSIVAEYVNHGKITSEPGSWKVEGIGEDFIPEISELELADIAYTITDQESFDTAREVVRKCGIMGGSTTGTLVAAAIKYCQAQTTPKKVLTLVCDTGNRYLSKLYNDYWMIEYGFLEKPKQGTLQDLIARPHANHSTIIIRPEEPVVTAYNRMRQHGLSQLPVLAGDRCIGIIDESDMLKHVRNDKTKFADPVKAAMTTDIKVVDYQADINEIFTEFDADRVAIVTQNETFLGLITRIDILNYLQKPEG